MSFEMLLNLYFSLLGPQEIVITATSPIIATKIVRRGSVAQWVGIQVPKAINVILEATLYVSGRMLILDIY